MATLKALFPCKKKPRRSSRLEIKEKVVTQSITIDKGPLGYLEIVPLELKFQLLSYLTSMYNAIIEIYIIKFLNFNIVVIKLYIVVLFNKLYILHFS